LLPNARVRRRLFNRSPTPILGAMRGEFVDVRGCRLYYYAAGTRGVGEPVIFVHGFPASSHLWQDVIAHMPAGHRLVVLDLLGFGRSDRPAGDGVLKAAELSAPAHAQRLQALMDELSIGAACIVGHGMGGAVAQALALDAPERVSRLCLVNSTAFEAWPRRAARLARLMCAAPAIGRRIGAPLLAGLVHGSLLTGFADRSRGRHSLDQYLHAFTARLGVDALVAQLGVMYDTSVASLGARLGAIRQPTAVLWGTDDPFLHVTLARRICAAIPGASLNLISDARHFSPEDAPDRVAAAIAALLKR
jgi:2-hydroxymuconate-semialdehyde hydrolase